MREVLTMIRRLFLCLAVCCLLTTAALGEGPSLPIDFSSGVVPVGKNFTQSGYQDSTITVTVESGRSRNCDYWVADIVIQDASQLRTVSAGGFESNRVMDGVRLANYVNAVLAINGDNSNATGKNGFGCVIRQGVTYLNNLDSEGHWKSTVMDVLLIDEDGDFHVMYRPQTGTETESFSGKKIVNAFSFGPILVDNGVMVEDFNGADRFIDMSTGDKRQRMAICQVGPLHYKAVCCAGPARGSRGMTLREFAELVASLDVQVAYNLDGGDSTVMAFNGKKINDPGNASTRKLVDIIYFASMEGMN